jgi:hypothetical protein
MKSLLALLAGTATLAVAVDASLGPALESGGGPGLTALLPAATGLGLLLLGALGVAASLARRLSPA